jgi:uncharacterized membrane protein YeaQ/YmgE (transglycosylase-associated protein family)
MKKIIIPAIASAIIITWVSGANAGEILGYPIVQKQATFYTMILGLIGASMGIVGAAYACFFLADLKKKKVVVKESLPRRMESFSGKLAAQGAK